MKTKAMATVLAALMVVSCVGMFVSDESSADDINDGNVVRVGAIMVASTNDAAKVTLLINEAAYVSGNYTISWSAAPISNSTTTGSWGTTVTGNATGFEGGEIGDRLTGLSISIGRAVSGESNPILGQYILTIQPSSDAPTKDVVVRAVITVDVNGVKMDLTPIYYIMSVEVNNNPTTELGSMESMTFIYGMSDSQPIKFIGGQQSGGYVPSEVNSLTWYAVGLPQGLAMSADGTISGTPLVVTGSKVNNPGVDVTVYARNSTGQNYVGTINVKVDPADDVNPGSFTYSVDGAKPLGTNQAFMVEQNGQVKLTINLVESSSGTPIVNVVGNGASDGRQNLTASPQDDSSYEYVIPTTGTGAYVVEMSLNGSATTSAHFMLYVFATPESAVQAEIIVSGTP